jgi:hypothetical protein
MYNVLFQTIFNVCVFIRLIILQRFDLYSVILFCCFYGGNRGKPTEQRVGENLLAILQSGI